jgi:hypothetical protein
MVISWILDLYTAAVGKSSDTFDSKVKLSITRDEKKTMKVKLKGRDS